MKLKEIDAVSFYIILFFIAILSIMLLAYSGSNNIKEDETLYGLFYSQE